MSLEQFEWFGDKQPSRVRPPNLQSFQCKIKKKEEKKKAREIWGSGAAQRTLRSDLGLHKPVICGGVKKELQYKAPGTKEWWNRKCWRWDGNAKTTRGQVPITGCCALKVAKDFCLPVWPRTSRGWGGKGQWAAKKGKWDYCVRMTEGKSEMNDVKTISGQEMKKSGGKDKKIPDSWNTTARL